MRIALQTISFGRRPADLPGILREVKRLGYDGVEFAQHPTQLGTPEGLYQTLTDRKLALVGLAGGSLMEKVRYAERYWYHYLPRFFAERGPRRDPDKQPYVYIDEWEDGRSEEAMRHAPLALHPHMYKPVQTDAEAERLLAKYPTLRFLPDTAHLTVAGVNVLAVIDKYFDRIDAVHLKDWTAEYGRAYHFYSRGFVELGAGDVHPEAIVELLKQKGFRGWLVVEQDASADPLASADKSRKWLQQECGV